MSTHTSIQATESGHLSEILKLINDPEYNLEITMGLNNILRQAASAPDIIAKPEDYQWVHLLIDIFLNHYKNNIAVAA